MTQTFEKLVWEIVKDCREKIMVVDNHHAYGIIKDRLDSFWEQVRLLQEDDDHHLMILGGLISLSAYTQLAAENLSLVPEQLSRDESADAAEQKAEEAKETLRNFIHMIDQRKQSIKPLQKGMKRFSLEFDDDTLLAWKSQVEEF